MDTNVHEESTEYTEETEMPRRRAVNPLKNLFE